MHVVVSDIDGSLILREQAGDKVFYGINKIAIDELQHTSNAHIALMSNFDLSDVDNELNTATTSISERRHINYISRQRLVTYLQQLNATLSITTQADPVHRTGININQGAYHAFYMEAYRAAQVGEAHYEQLKRAVELNNPFKQYNNCVNEISKLPDYDIELEKNIKLADEINKVITSQKRYDAKAATQKHFMFKYIMECLPKDITTLTYIEDDPICIQAIANLCLREFPNIPLKIIHIREVGTPSLSMSHPNIYPNIDYRCLERPSIPLYMLGTKNYEKAIDFINEHVERKPNLYQANLSFEKMSELVTKEALYIEILLESLPNTEFANKFHQLLTESYVGTSLETIKKNGSIDPANERKKLISVLASMSEDNKSSLSKKFNPTEKGFTYAGTDQVVFCYLPELLTRYLPQNSLALNNMASHLFRQLESYHDSSMEGVRQSINNCQPGFWRSNEKQMLEQYPKIILNILEQLVSHRYNEHTELNQLHLQQNTQVTPKS